MIEVTVTLTVDVPGEAIAALPGYAGAMPDDLPVDGLTLHLEDARQRALLGVWALLPMELRAKADPIDSSVSWRTVESVVYD